jgi:hypothetical protein
LALPLIRPSGTFSPWTGRRGSGNVAAVAPRAVYRERILAGR